MWQFNQNARQFISTYTVKKFVNITMFLFGCIKKFAL